MPLAVLLALLLALGTVGGRASAGVERPASLAAGTAAGDVGYMDQPFTGAGTAPTGSKPESKLWWNGGSWWASMWSQAHSAFDIFRLDLSAQQWVDTGVAIDGRPGTRSDALWDGTHLYVASHVFTDAAASGFPSRLYRFSYDATAKTYSLDAGFPVSINNFKTETLVIDKDSTGKLWATWTQGAQVYVNRSTANDATWGTPFVLPVKGATNLTSDDISSVVAFAGKWIGVMWSNQSTAAAVYFSVHVDGQPDTTWQASRTAVAGPKIPDDHINLKTLQADGGRVFAVVKTSLDDVTNPNPNSPLIMLLSRDITTGDWSNAVVGRVQDCQTRPILLIDRTNRILHVYMTAPVTGCPFTGYPGSIFEKTSPIANPSFPTGRGTAVIASSASPNLNNATSTKQDLTSQTGLVVLASNDSDTGNYWHSYEAIPGPAPPLADFTGTPNSGVAPLTVSFADASTGSPSSWSWDFGDGSTSTAQNPSHTYLGPGTYTVALTAANSAGSNTNTKVGYITASSVQAPVADFTASPTSGVAPLSVSFTDASTGSPTGWSWDFGDGSTSTVQNPTHTYAAAGTYTVALTASNAGGSNTNTKTGYISASPAITAPVADFTASPTSGVAPLSVSFTDASTGSPTGWSWDFGDGSTSTVQNPTHTYAAPGTYDVTLVATNAGGSDTKAKSAFISTHDPVVAAAGDIACPPGSATTAGACQQQATSDLLVSGAYDSVLPLGDEQYDNGELTNFQQVFDPTWGRVKAIMAPTPGNHEYQTAGAAGYFGYFGALAGPSNRGYYSFDLGGWHVISLDSEIAMGVGSPQETWLRNDLAAHSNVCTLAYWHQPLFTSDSVYGPGISAVRPLYDDLYYNGADIVLNGHAHDYERFVPQDPFGASDASHGIREFVVGTGGDDLRTLGTRLSNSAIFSSASFGVLGLTLHPASYDWRFVPIEGGTLQDSGTGTCSTDAPAPPPAPVADFNADVTTGTAPLTVKFTDASTGEPNTWSWDFGDGTTSTSASPTHTYLVAGTYSVSLTVSNYGGSNTKTNTAYVTVNPAAPVADFTGIPTSGSAPLAVKFSDSSTNNPTIWSWDFGDGGTSTAQDPSHTYSAAGTYTVTLTVSNAGGSSTKTRTGYITMSAPVSSYTSEVLADSPISYWRLGETSGTTAADSVGANTGALKGGVTLGALGALVGDTNAAMTFDGSTGYISVGNSATLNLTGDLTVEAWAKPSVLDGTTRAVVHKGGTGGFSTYQYRIGLTSGNTWRGTVYIGSTNLVVTSPSIATTSSWTYLVMTRVGSTLTLYVNGTKVATATASGALNTSTGVLAIGRTGSTSVDYFKGSVDEVAVYATALSAARIAAHYRAGTGG